MTSVAFVKDRKKPKHHPNQLQGFLATAWWWLLEVDLGKLKFPDTIAVTTLRLDTVLLSEKTRYVISLELAMKYSRPSMRT